LSKFETDFQPVETFTWEANRSERSHQARWLVPLLAQPDGREWFCDQVECPCSSEVARAADVFHLCFPLRDVFTTDYYQCRGNPILEDQFIAYYNRLFALPEDFGVHEIWRTAPNNEIRHPAAGGRSGWFEDFLRERIADDALYKQARDVRRMLGTEADVLLITSSHVLLVECKYLGALSSDQYRRQQMMGMTLANWLGKQFHFSIVVDNERDSRFARINLPYVLWTEIKAQLGNESDGNNKNQ
jgi:hypothetical protein